jgi:hypothetical protein
MTADRHKSHHAVELAEAVVPEAVVAVAVPRAAWFFNTVLTSMRS